VKALSTSCLLLLLLACSPERVEHRVFAEKPYFDLKAFLEKEIESLPPHTALLKRVAQKDSTAPTEELRLENPDPTLELKPFLESDLNRRAWVDKYAVDSTFTPEGKLQRLTYRSLDPKLKIRTLEVEFDPTGAVRRIVVEKDLKSLIAGAHRKMTYLPGHGFRIENHQEFIGGGSTTYLLEGTWEY